MSSSDESSPEDEYAEEGERFLADLRRMRENDPAVTKLVTEPDSPEIPEWMAEDWTQFGRDVSNSSYLRSLEIYNELDEHRVSSFFRGLTRSDSLTKFNLNNSEYGLEGIQSMLPFLQNANSLECFELSHNMDGFTLEEFSLLWSALRDTRIKRFEITRCRLSSIDIDVTCVPKNLVELDLSFNEINADGCREIAKLLQMRSTTLEELYLGYNKIDDEGLATLVQALQTNTSLKHLTVYYNSRIGPEGMKLVLKLLNDISSIESTLQSNHTLRMMTFEGTSSSCTDIDREIQRTLAINTSNRENPDAAAKQKVIQTQLNSQKRAQFRRLQGLDDGKNSPFTDLDPLLLPEVLAIVDKHFWLSEFFELFRTCVADLWTTINRKKILQQTRDEISKQMEALAEKKKELDTEIDLIEQAEVNEVILSKRARIA